MLLVLVPICALAVWFDVRERRLPNWLTLAALAGALAIRALSGDMSVWPGLASAGLALGFGFPFFVAGGLGAGDVKLMAGLAAFLDPAQLLVALGVMAGTGAAMAIWAAARRNVLGRTLANVHLLILTLGRKTFTGWKGESDEAPLTRVSPGGVSNPYGLAIVAGVLAGWFL